MLLQAQRVLHFSTSFLYEHVGNSKTRVLMAGIFDLRFLCSVALACYTLSRTKKMMII